MTTRTVTGTWLNSGLVPHSGVIEFQPNVYLRDTVDDHFLTVEGFHTALDENGSISVDLTTTDDTDISTTDWTWTITERIVGLANRTWSFSVPTAAGSLDLTDAT